MTLSSGMLGGVVEEDGASTNNSSVQYVLKSLATTSLSGAARHHRPATTARMRTATAAYYTLRGRRLGSNQPNDTMEKHQTAPPPSGSGDSSGESGTNFLGLPTTTTALTATANGLKKHQKLLNESTPSIYTRTSSNNANYRQEGPDGNAPSSAGWEGIEGARSLVRLGGVYGEVVKGKPLFALPSPPHPVAALSARSGGEGRSDGDEDSGRSSHSALLLARGGGGSRGVAGGRVGGKP